MNLEITIKVPIGTGDVSVEQRRTGAAPEAAHAPPPIHLVESMTSGNGGADRVSETRGPPEPPRGATAHQPPSPAEFGLEPRSGEAEPPPPAIIERMTGRPFGATGVPPGLEDVPGPGGPETGGPATPPDLPDMSRVPSVEEEFAPPPVDGPSAAPDEAMGSSSGKPGAGRKPEAVEKPDSGRKPPKES